jgi:hypothetical protein
MTPRPIRRSACSSSARAIPGHQGLGGSGQGRHGVIVPNPKVRQRPLHLSCGIRLCAEGAGLEAAAKDFVKAAVRECAGAGWRRARRDHDLCPARHWRCAGDIRERGCGDRCRIRRWQVRGDLSLADHRGAKAPVAVVDTVVDKKKTRDLLPRPISISCSRRRGRRSSRRTISARAIRLFSPSHAGKIPEVETFTVEALLGGWAKVNTDHFADGALYDQIMTRR